MLILLVTLDPSPQHILDTIPDYKESVIIARHPSATRRATSYAERLQVNFAVMHGELKAEEEVRS